ncbi:MAG: RdgB/HAM1 family non-canonical purine NTP pyrophosphatase [Glaciecola sp.]|jgi:XTP/dITP diphosphohydrolase
MSQSINEIVLASGNQGKLAEFADLFASFSIKVSPQGAFSVEDVPETGTTFVENAIIKARHAAKVTGLPAIADDSGLCVSALGGAPGIYSSRYSGVNASDENNITKLLQALENTSDRSAYFICVLVFMRHADDPTPLICEGRWHGQIAQAKAGDGGFGYDPIFYCPTLQRHAAECDKALKATVSHRAQALQLLLAKMESLLG